ncbi:hypothetical protein [Sphaerothrix gracilis]|uniref:hypothetical protein n=1 Tax=Sphaerothrix gracilis TaxID=3151835 RepID=UPI0031FD166E
MAFRNRAERVAFEPNTEAGTAALAAVETFSDQGRTHVAPGQSVNYDGEFPTSGPTTRLQSCQEFIPTCSVQNNL